MFEKEKKQQHLPEMDKGMLAWGAVLGFIVGGLITLFTAPKSGKENRQQITQSAETVRKTMETSIPTDPVKDSLAEGKAAARRRRDELGVKR
jgi:gas vesicle protein